MRGARCGWFAVAAMIVGQADAVTVTVLPDSEYQTIEGFGAFGAQGSFAHDDLGVTLVRMHVPHEFEATNENGDPNTMDLSRFGTSAISSQIALVNAMKGYGDVKFIASIWTPPAWMKDLTRDVSPTCSDGPGNCGGHLRADMYEEFAERCVAFCKLIEQNTGVRIYAFSIQNEPAFIEWYISCVYTPTEYRDALKAVGARFQRENYPMRFFGAEDMLEALAVPGRDYAQQIAQDTAARKYLWALAVHGYTDGVHPVSSSNGSRTWGRLGGISKTLLGCKAWMTETSGFSQDWSGAWNLAANIYMALVYGNVSAWAFWSYNECSEYGLVCNNAHTERSAVSKNFYRWVRPGAVRIGARSDTAAVFVTAFRHKEDRTLTIVLLNEGPATTVSLVGPGLPQQLSMYVSTASKRCVSAGPVGTAAIALEGSSVTTLYGQNYNPPLHTAWRGQPERKSGRECTRAALFMVDGRRVRLDAGGPDGVRTRLGVAIGADRREYLLVVR